MSAWSLSVFVQCYFLLVNLFTPFKELRAMITDALSRFLPHPEASFSFNEDLRNYVLKTQDKFPGQNLKTNNPLVMLVRLLLRLEEYKCDRTVNRRN